MAHNNFKVATLAIVAFAALGTSYYFLNSSISADVTPPGLPNNTNAATIVLPPVPGAPINQPASTTTTSGSSSTNSSSSFSATNGASDFSNIQTPTSSTTDDSMSTFGLDDPTLDQGTSTGTNISSGIIATPTAITSELSPVAAQSINNNNFSSGTLATPQNSLPTAQPASKLYGIVAAIVSAIAFIALIFVLIKGKTQPPVASY